MTIENSALTYGLFAIFALTASVRSFKKRKNYIRAIGIILWVAACYMVFSCCILPVQLYRTSTGNFSFASQFDIITGEYFTDILSQNYLSYLNFFFSFLIFSFFTYAIFEKQRQWKGAVFLLITMAFVHLSYNMLLNAIVGEVVKYIRGEDFICMAFGYLIGNILCRILFKLWPLLGTGILENYSERT